MNRLSARNSDGTAVKEKRSVLGSNPVMRRLEKVDESAAENCVTYSGITVKTTFFLLMTVAGIFLEVILSKQLATGSTFTFDYRGFQVELYTGEMIALAAAVLLGVVFQLLAFFVKGSTSVTGALYCVTQGYFISFLVFKVLHGMEYIGVLALAITLLIILVMAILFTTGVVRVTKKFRMVMLTLFISVIAISLITLIASFIPFTRGIVSAIMGNFWVSVGISVIYIVIAALFLISDFAVIQSAVENQLPKKYEWQAAFGLAFTVLWIYLKVLQLLITIFGRGSRNS